MFVGCGHQSLQVVHTGESEEGTSLAAGNLRLFSTDKCAME